MKAVPNQDYGNRHRRNGLRLGYVCGENCKYQRAVPEPTEKDEGSLGQEAQPVSHEMMFRRCQAGMLMGSAWGLHRDANNEPMSQGLSPPGRLLHLSEHLTVHLTALKRTRAGCSAN